MSVSVSVGGTSVSVSVGSGIGPQGPAGSGGGTAATVVNGLTGTISIVGSGISVAAAGTTITLTSLAAVSSVNGKTGVVSLAAVDVTAASAVHLHHADDITAGTINRDLLPVATTKAIGAVQASSGLSVDDNGHLTANVRSVAGRTGDVSLSGGDVSGVVTSINSLSGAVAIAAGSNITVAAGGTTVSISSTGGGSPGGVTSVAAVTGSVTITAFGLSTSTSGQAVIFDARPVRTTPAAFTASQNDYNPGAGDIFRISNGTTNTLDVTGLATTQISLEALFINVSTHTSASIRFRHQSTSSTAVNRIISPWGGDVVLASGGTAGHGAAVLVYDTTDSRWRVTG